MHARVSVETHQNKSSPLKAIEYPESLQQRGWIAAGHAVVTHCSFLIAHCSLLLTPYSLLLTHHPSLDVFSYITFPSIKNYTTNGPNQLVSRRYTTLSHHIDHNHPHPHPHPLSIYACNLHPHVPSNLNIHLTVQRLTNYYTSSTSPPPPSKCHFLAPYTIHSAGFLCLLEYEEPKCSFRNNSSRIPVPNNFPIPERNHNPNQKRSKMFEAHAYPFTLCPETRPMKRRRRKYHASPQWYDSTWITNPFF